MLDWRTVQVNEKLIYHVDEFDTVKPCNMDAIVTEVHTDHIIAKCDGMNLWIDDFNKDMFYKSK